MSLPSSAHCRSGHTLRPATSELPPNRSTDPHHIAWMNSRTRPRRPASIGSNQPARRRTAVSASNYRVGDFVLLLVIVWSPPRRANDGILWASTPGDYANVNSNHPPNGTRGKARGRARSE